MRNLSWKIKFALSVLAAFLIVSSGWLISQFGLQSLFLFAFLAIVLVVLYKTIQNPFWGFLGIIFFLPFERVPTINFSGVDIKINIVLGFITLICWLITLLSNPQKFKLQPNRIAIPLAIFVTTMIVSLWQAVNFDRALQVLFFILFTIALYLLTVNLISTKDRLQQTILILFISSMVVSIFGLFQFFGDVSGIPISVTLLKDIYTKEVFGFPRIQAFSMEPLYFANYLLVPVSLGLSYFFAKTQKDKQNESNKFLANRNLLTGLLVLLLVNFILTVSRGAYMALVAGLAILGFVYFRHVFTWKNIITFIVAGVLIGYGVIFALSKGEFRATNEFIGHVMLKDFNAGESIQGRLQGFKSALSMVNKSPIFGIGLGNYGPNVSGKPYVNPPGGWPIVNNQYIETLTETGIAGFLAFVILLVTVIWQSFKAYKMSTDPFLKATMIGLLAAFIGILIQYNSFSTLYIIHIWILIGLMIGTQNLIKKEPRDSK